MDGIQQNVYISISYTEVYILFIGYSVAITSQISFLTNSHAFNVAVFRLALLESETTRHHSRPRHSSGDYKTLLIE
jgi:hypothetical protein